MILKCVHLVRDARWSIETYDKIGSARNGAGTSFGYDNSNTDLCGGGPKK